jgi:hypothetical protein
MGKVIIYSCSGEGLGHAGRTQAVIENLPDYQIHLFTWGEAFEFFHKQNYPYLHKIVSLHFGQIKPQWCPCRHRTDQAFRKLTVDSHI